MSPFDGAVLVTGAGGFIGGRVVEVLEGLPNVSVKASIRRWSSAARIGRLPVKIVLCDITNAEQVRRAMDGVAFVVHCAYGDRHTTVHGTRTVLQAALEAGAKRVVHLSTMEVYGDGDGEVTEDAPLRKDGSAYRDAKIDAELLCREYLERGLPLSVLRPTIVYGPFSTVYTVGFAERLVAGGGFPARDECQGTCNLLYVDDLVAAILLALTRDEAAGEAFNVNGEGRLTWWDYLNSLAGAIGLPPLNAETSLVQRVRLAALPRARRLTRALLDRFEGPIMALYRSNVVAQRLMRRGERILRSAPSADERRLFRRKAYAPVSKANELLGYRSRFPVPRGIDLSVAWLQHHGVLGVPEMAQWND